MSTYQVGEGIGDILLEVDVNTIGLAASRAIILIVNSIDPSNAVAHSENASGDIAKTPIGKADKIKGKRLSILTKVNLLQSIIENKIEANRASVTYLLNNGLNGKQIYSNPTKAISSDNSTIVFSQNIDLI